MRIRCFSPGRHPRSWSLIAAAIVIWAPACSPVPSGPADQDADITCSDQDDDGICDEAEGASRDIDTDKDGTPDYLDNDSDGDGIADSTEAGPDPMAPPDSDGDGIPDFRDQDSDGNGRGDALEGADDTDKDGIADFRDQDDDADGILDVTELGPNPDEPLDSDQDGTPDFRDPDSDNDSIPDAREGTRDSDGDGLPDYRDRDSDDDGVFDAVEAGDDDPATEPADSDGDGLPDYLDRDSDDDGLADGDEDRNGNGVLDPGETDRTDPDSDHDAVTDLVEEVAGTDPLDGQDNPRARGDFVFMVPYQESSSPKSDQLSFTTSFQALDLYILQDVSGSMSNEAAALKTHISEALTQLVCGQGQTPQTDLCVADLQTGVGAVGKQGYVLFHIKPIDDDNLLSDPGPDDESTESLLPLATGGDYEQQIRAMRATIEGSCDSDGSRLGVACFRPDAFSLILLSTDEDFSQDAWYGQDTAQLAYDALADAGIRVVGVTGSPGQDNDYLGSLKDDLLAMAGGDPRVDLVPTITSLPQTPACNALGSDPFYEGRAILSGPDDQAANAMVCAIQALLAAHPQTVTIEATNGPQHQTAQGEDLDVAAAFIDHIEVYADGTGTCPGGLTTDDGDGDGFDDTYEAVPPSSSLCWKLLVADPQSAVPPAPDDAQLFTTILRVRGEGGALLDQRTVYFVVPPVIPQPNPQ